MFLRAAVIKGVLVILFGLGFKYDYYWLPEPTISYPHFSYGLAIVSTFISFFSSIAHVNYRNIVREEYHQPAMLTAIPPPVMMYKM